MAKLIYGLNVSLDGYVGHMKMGPPGVDTFNHFIRQVRACTGMLYGTGMYEVMRYWDEDQPEWDEVDREYAEVWKSKPKWVVSNSLASVSPNATLVKGDLETAIRELKASQVGDIEVAGPVLAGSLTALGLIDEYQLYYRSVALGSGKPFFVGDCPSLRLVANEVIGENVVRLTYVPA